MPESQLVHGVRALGSLFSAEALWGMLLRIAVFVGAAKFLERIKLQASEECSFAEDQVTCNDLVAAFGKCILVVIYTYSWLHVGDPSIGSSEHVWRWLSVYVAIGMCTRNLFCGLDFDPDFVCPPQQAEAE